MTFQLVADSANVDIRFGYGVVDGGATGRASYSYDGQNHFLPGTTVRLEYSDANPPPTSLIAHEVGHVLGLDHYEATQSIMNSTVNTAWTGLFAPDLEGIRSLYGDNLPAQPADDFAGGTGTTGQVSAGNAVTGNLEAGADRDWFRIQLTAGTTYTIELQGVDSGNGTLVDPYLRLYNGAGTSVLAQDDDNGAGRNSLVTFTAATTGTYYLAAGAYNDAGTGTYRIATSSVANANTPPVATINDHSLQTNQWSRVDSWISYSDANGNPATQYQFWDSGSGASSGYFWTPANAHHAAGAAITVAAADLASVWVRGGQAGGSETMWVRAFDGTDWGQWDAFTFNTTAPANTPPVATINDHSLGANEWSRVASWISYSDANGNPATQYQFMDGGTGANSGYFWTPGNAHHPANTAITVAAADLNNVWIRGGTAGGSETMQVRAFDGTDWGPWDTFTFNTVANTPPVATINDHSLQEDQWSRVDSWISYSDANGNPATQYEFWDSGTAADSGYFWTPGNAHHAAGTGIVVAAADLDDVWVRGGHNGGTETMWVRAYDGANWGPWDSFTLNTLG